MADEKELHGVRIIEVGSDAGPMMYRVEVLWYPSPGWKTDLLTHDRKAARRRVGELQDGLNATPGERTVWSWYANGYHERDDRVQS